MSGPARPLRIVSEEDALVATDMAGLQAPVSSPGSRALLQAPPPGDHGQAVQALHERSAGPVRPERQDPWRSAPTHVCRVAEVVHLPRFGALVWPDGTAPSAPASGSLAGLAHLAEAPGMAATPDGLSFTPPPDTPRIASAGVFMPWGGGFNYGHFLLDALPSLLALEEAGLDGLLPPIAPALKPWQRELIGLLRGDADAVREIAAPAVRLDEAAYATSMDHFLHAPNALLERVRARLLARAPQVRPQCRRLYFSRRSHAYPMRILLNEVELERALAARGFEIVRLERLRPRDQIALARDAECVVGPTGAGMANALFAPPGTLVVDIQPQVFPGAWVGAFGQLIGHDWRVYYAPAPVPASEVPWARRVRRGFRFGYRLPLEAFLAFLDARL